MRCVGIRGDDTCYGTSEADHERQQSFFIKREAGPASLERGQAHRPEAAEQRDELAPFQLTEVHPPPQPGAQHSRLASIKSRYSLQCRISSRLMSEMGQK